jgi:hypothetical protein
MKPLVKLGCEFHHILCSCASPECTVRFVLDKQDWENDVLLEFRLSVWAPWWKRILHAINYVFAKSHHAEYGNVILDDDSVDKIISLLIQHKLDKKQNG